ncbi:MAG TPA: MmgE/PrpD family protein [Burkholderiales bacterium]|nr:MmgE/PrpD family protein [Burkholderiales bacterium]
MRNDKAAGNTVSKRLAQIICATRPEPGPDATEHAVRLILDIIGLCLAARDKAYVKAALASIDSDGPCTVLGASRGLSVEGASFVNGIAAHGEDFDDTYEGGPVHVGAVIVPALLAAAERHHLSGADLFGGIAVGAEVMCRLCRVAPIRVHKAGFHPTAIFGVMGAVAGVGAALRVPQEVLVNALGIAGSMASGIIEYLADGSWTKRMHPGWAAQSAYRAVRLAMAGFHGPATVFEGQHGLFHGFANTLDGDFDAMLDGFGQPWLWTTLAFKPYACGTMAHPYIDCARAFRKDGIDPESITRIECETAEGIVHRLWEPHELKSAPPNGYAAKFSIPYAIASGMLRDAAGLEEFDDEVVKQPELVRLAHKVSYIVDPENPYPDRFIGHLKVTLDNGDVREYRQNFFRGGNGHPLSSEELRDKFIRNCGYGGLSEQRAERVADDIVMLFASPRVDLSPFAG